MGSRMILAPVLLSAALSTVSLSPLIAVQTVGAASTNPFDEDFALSAARPALQTITATHTYVMGDNDSRNEARQLCFLEAKRKVLERAGSVVQSSTEVRNFQLTTDQITSYSAAALSVEIVKEDFATVGGHSTLTLTVKADVYMPDIQTRLAEIVADKGLQGRITEQQEQLRQLEQQVRAVTSNLGTASVISAGALRKERNVALDGIQKLSNIKLAAVKRIVDEKRAGEERSRQALDRLKKYGVIGMNKLEVRQLLGKPIEEFAGEGGYAWKYGPKVWVCFKKSADNGADLLSDAAWLVSGAGVNGLCADAWLSRVR